MAVHQVGSFLDHFMRQNRNHHVQLSRMADAKANMLITVSSLVITFSVGYLNQPHLRAAAVTLIVFSVLTLMLAVYAVMPKVSLLRGKEAAPDLNDPMFNILFFGDFLKLPFEQFNAEMDRVMNEPSLTYESMIRELYSMGYYLATKKYRYLRLAYAAFVGGVLLSMLILAGSALLGLAAR